MSPIHGDSWRFMAWMSPPPAPAAPARRPLLRYPRRPLAPRPGSSASCRRRHGDGPAVSGRQNGEGNGWRYGDMDGYIYIILIFAEYINSIFNIHIICYFVFNGIWMVLGRVEVGVYGLQLWSSQVPSIALLKLVQPWERVANSALQQSLQSTTQPGFIPLLL